MRSTGIPDLDLLPVHAQEEISQLKWCELRGKTQNKQQINNKTTDTWFRTSIFVQCAIMKENWDHILYYF